MATTKKKPSALNVIKARMKDLENQLEQKDRDYESLNRLYNIEKAANNAVRQHLDEVKKEKQQFEEESSDYEGLRKFLLGKLKNKRPEYVNSLFNNVKESINVDHDCKIASLREDMKSLVQEHEKLSTTLRKTEGHRL